MSKIECTHDYEQFCGLHGNRNLDERHIAKLTRSMKKHGFLRAYHIVVDSEMRIKDGQHRAEAAKRLGLPIYYVVDDQITLEGIRDAGGAAEAWSVPDYISAYAKSGVPSYVQIQKAADLHGVSTALFCRILGAGKDNYTARDAIKSGEFEPTQTDWHFAEIVISRAKDFTSILGARALQAPFINTMIFLCSWPQYNHAQMMQRLEYQTAKLRPAGTKEEYIRMLEEIYNYRSHQHLKVDFPSHKSMIASQFKRRS